MSYIPLGAEIAIFDAARGQGLSLLLKGPTGCGKTRFVQAMAERVGVPLHSVACHEDLTAADLVGRFLLKGGETVWQDGPLTRAVRDGGICYLDEIVEARADTTVVLHPLADHRRELSIERLGEVLIAPPGFMLILSYNPGYQSVLKDLKPSTRQRMVTIGFGYPDATTEALIVSQESGVTADVADQLVRFGRALRGLKREGVGEGASTRTLIAAAKLIGAGIAPRAASEVAIVATLTDDLVLARSLRDMIAPYLG